ncbi:hypothetical protein PM023_13070 [Halorubrum ezzemoulense]|uniref:hypothetical protein n=1 Tax=Halorubrum ezzemoulense TaxID=337243 RepID=UPI00232C102A|nr:hypothetical protein [Halorubrum ezzemoulense]MDB2225601.1 hypothetical protein [Halorubrum ezzemoulense]
MSVRTYHGLRPDIAHCESLWGLLVVRTSVDVEGKVVYGVSVGAGAVTPSCGIILSVCVATNADTLVDTEDRFDATYYQFAPNLLKPDPNRDTE